MDRGKKILILCAVCSGVALLSWGFALIYTLTHKDANTANTITEEVQATTQTATTQEKNNSFYEHGLIETQDFTIKLTGYKIINPGETGNKHESMPVIGFWYDVTNKSGREITASNAWIYCIRAVQDNDQNRVNELNMAALPDARYRDTQYEQIKQGGTVSNAVAYILTDQTTPVDLIATNGILGEDLGERSFEIQGVSPAQSTDQTGTTTQAATQTTEGGAATTTSTRVPSLADPDTQEP